MDKTKHVLLAKARTAGSNATTDLPTVLSMYSLLPQNALLGPTNLDQPVYQIAWALDFEDQRRLVEFLI